MDMFTELYRMNGETYDARLAKARVSSYAVLRDKFLPFLKQASTDQEVELRFDLGSNLIDSVIVQASETHDVKHEDVLSYIKEKLAAEVAVTKPKTVDPEKEIGGTEGKKYLETSPRKVPEEGKPDAESDVNELEAVVEEPVRHKQEQVDLNKDTQKDNAPKNAAARAGATQKKAAHNPTGQAVIRYLQTMIDPTVPLEDNWYDDFLAEYMATPEQFEEEEVLESDWQNERFAPRDPNREY